MISGTMIGHYRVADLLGAGRDGGGVSRHGHEAAPGVAIKVMPALLARDPEWAGRFQREARLLASLNHPHIAAIHGIEQADDTQAWCWSSWKGRRWLTASGKVRSQSTKHS